LDKEVKILFKGLDNGFHDFHFDIGNSFLKELEYSEFENGDLHVDIKMEKQTTTATLKININGTVDTICDRCLDDLTMDIHYEGLVLAGYNLKEDDSEKEIISLKAGENEINLSHYIYESICLSMPLQRLHGKDKNGNLLCNRDMIEKLNKYLIK